MWSGERVARLKMGWASNSKPCGITLSSCAASANVDGCASSPEEMGRDVLVEAVALVESSELDAALLIEAVFE